MRTRSWRGLTSAVRHRRLCCSSLSPARLPPARRRRSCRTTTRTGSSTTTSSGTSTRRITSRSTTTPRSSSTSSASPATPKAPTRQVSADLKHDLAFKVPLILYKTESEFQQQNIDPGELPEGVLAFAEPYRDRMVLPIDEPSDALYRLITHELTHIFEFDIIPRTLLRRGLPLWVDEGLSDYETGYWNPFDLMTVRDAAIADIIPPMSDFQGVQFADGRLPYNLGHAAFEFIESKWGKEGLRQFLFALRKSVIGGGDSAYEEAFKLKPDEFDEQFDKYLKDRFKPFRDKERPADYGRDLAPKRGKTHYVSVISIEPSPSGDLIAVAGRQPQGPGARHHPAVDQGRQGDPQPDRRLQHRASASSTSRRRAASAATPCRGCRGRRPATASPTSRARRSRRTLVLQNVLTQQDREALRSSRPSTCRSRPTSAPTASTSPSPALRNAIADIFIDRPRDRRHQEPHQRRVRRLRPDLGARRQVDRLHRARQRQRQAVPARSRAPGKKTQLTFGTHDDGARAVPRRRHARVPVDGGRSRTSRSARRSRSNGNIYNIWTLNLKNGELKQYTDALGGNVSPVVAAATRTRQQKIAFVTYYKGEYGIHTLPAQKEPLHTVASADFGSAGPDHRLPAAAEPHAGQGEPARRRASSRSCSSRAGRRSTSASPAAATSSAAPQVTFTDVLGDQQFNFYAESVSQYRSLSLSYTESLAPVPVRAAGLLADAVLLRELRAATFYDPQYGFLSRDRRAGDADRARRHGLRDLSVEPLRATRAERPASISSSRSTTTRRCSMLRQSSTSSSSTASRSSPTATSCRWAPPTCARRPCSASTGRSRATRCASATSIAPPIGGFLSRQTADVDARKYIRLATNGVLAFRFRGLQQLGRLPELPVLRRQLRAARLRVSGVPRHRRRSSPTPSCGSRLIEAALTPIGVVGGLRAVALLQLRRRRPVQPVDTGLDEGPDTVPPRSSGSCRTRIRCRARRRSMAAVQDITGFRLVDGRASYGIGLETFALGFPIHFDWSWRTLFNKDWEDIVYAYQALADGDIERQPLAAEAEILGLDRLRLLDSTRPKRRGFRRTHGWVRLRFRCQASGGLPGTAAATRAPAGAGSAPAALPSLRDAAPHLRADRLAPPVAA